MKKTKQQKGITLIALIITIVVLLILAVVAIRAVQGDGIIQYAQNARDEYISKTNEEQEIINEYLSQIEGSLSEGKDSSSKITWTKTSEGDLAVGSTVVTSTGENFYVIGFDGNNDETVILLAKDNIDTKNLVQSSSAGTVEFASTKYWSSGESDINSCTVPAGVTSVVTTAKAYGATLGGTGRLMTLEEAEAFHNINTDILYGKNGKSSSSELLYWLGTVGDDSATWITSWSGADDSCSFQTLPIYADWWEDGLDMGVGVRPIVEISKSKIS